MLEDTTKNKPLYLTDAQAADLAAGKSHDFEGQSRPRDFTAKHLEALKQGHEVDIENIPAIKRVE